MKRSEINRIMREALVFIEKEHRFHLPPFAHWSPEAWREKDASCRDIARQQLGWDITDFGSGDFTRSGLFLFTLRNGRPEDLGRPGAKPYAEKLMIVREGQVTPCHFHHQKMEDIINRGGGELVVRLWNADAADGLSQEPLCASLDGVERHLPAGATVRLGPGESICLPTRQYHSFWGAEGKGPVLVGEVSGVNDDRCDNRFLEPVGRFAELEEDEAPLHLLAHEYARYYRYA